MITYSDLRLAPRNPDIELPGNLEDRVHAQGHALSEEIREGNSKLLATGRT